jgi:hypothetical protein
MMATRWIILVAFVAWTRFHVLRRRQYTWGILGLDHGSVVVARTDLAVRLTWVGVAHHVQAAAIRLLGRRSQVNMAAVTTQDVAWHFHGRHVEVRCG